MRRFTRFLVLLISLLAPCVAMGASTYDTLVSRLRSHDDLRVRVRAALDLGKSRDLRARLPLERALTDTSGAVRAASAAALRVLGDPKAIPALKRAEDDQSASVRAQVKSSIAALEERAARAAEKPEVLVQLGHIGSRDTLDTRKPLLVTMKHQSRRKLESLPGVMVLLDSEDPGSEAKARRVPLVMVTGILHELEQSRHGSLVVYSASVEFVVHAMPEQQIVGMVHGSAKAKISVEESKNPKRADVLERKVLAAAIDSAMQQASGAIKAAAE